MIQCSARPFPYPIARQALKVIRSLRGQGWLTNPSKAFTQMHKMFSLIDFLLLIHHGETHLSLSVSFCQVPLRQDVSKDLLMFRSCPG